MTKHSTGVLRVIYDNQPPEIQQAIDALEDRGFVFGGHFGYDNAIQLLDEMDQAFLMGRLFEFLRCRFGMGVG